MRKHLILALTVAIPLILSGCSGGEVKETKIVGRVLDTFHGGGVKGAQVILTLERTQVSTTTTDDAGNFVFSGLSPGTYDITVSKEGFFDNKVLVTVEEGKEAKTEIGLVAAFGGT